MTNHEFDIEYTGTKRYEVMANNPKEARKLAFKYFMENSKITFVGINDKEYTYGYNGNIRYGRKK